MSCNPAIGGLGKGHLVREIDALDGLMGRVADQGGIQFRVLNRRKGPAVRGPRAQADRKLYAAAMQRAIRETANLDGDRRRGRRSADRATARVAGVRLADGREFDCGAVGADHRHVPARPDPHRRDADAGRPGRRGAGGRAVADARAAWLRARPAEDRHAAAARRRDDRLGRGRDAAGRRAAGAVLDADASGSRRRRSSAASPARPPATHEIIRANVHRSPMYSGQIASRGPRYCPSIEDKIVRFGERDGHQIFLEPEGLDDATVYPNGISTSLPEEVQRALVATHSGPGKGPDGAAGLRDRIRPCRSARAQARRSRPSGSPGCSWPARSTARPATRRPPRRGLSRASTRPRAPAGRGEIVFDRAEGYLGVMIDDLVTRGVTEPYRMFTSRAEYRLTLRADNADQRLTARGIAIGCVGAGAGGGVRRQDGRARCGARARRSRSRSRRHEARAPRPRAQPGRPAAHARSTCCPIRISASPTSSGSGRSSARSRRRSRSRSRSTPNTRSIWSARPPMSRPIGATKASSCRRASTIGQMTALSMEVRQKLQAIRPRTIGQAGRIDGMTPAALTLLVAHVRRGRRNAERQPRS